MDVPYTVEQDQDDGGWSAVVLLVPGIGAVGEGDTLEEAIADLRAGWNTLLEGLREHPSPLYDGDLDGLMLVPAAD